jgi:hypothetical protein
MPIRFTYDDQKNILFTTAEGLVCYEEVQRHLDAEAAANDLGYREIIDASAASTNITVDQTKELARRLEALMHGAPFGRTAVVTNNDVVFGMTRMLSILSELWSGPQIEVFRSFDDGLAWLMRESPI